MIFQTGGRIRYFVSFLTALTLLPIEGGRIVAEEILADCQLTARNIRGKPGSRHVVHCPAQCLHGRVWGSTIYTDDSAICLAAVHAGALTPAGGRVEIEIGAGADGFFGSTQHNVTSSAHGPWNRSFTLLPGNGNGADDELFLEYSPVRILFYWFLFFAAILLMVWWFQRRRRQVDALAKLFQELARERNLHFARPKKSETGIVCGSDNGREVVLKSFSVRSDRSSQKKATRHIHIETRWKGTGGMEFLAYPRSHHRSADHLPVEPTGAREFRTNDDIFDREVCLISTGGDMAALFDTGVRAAILDYFMDPQGWDLLLTAESIRSTIRFRPLTWADIAQHLKMQRAVAKALEKIAG